jgi:uncharacterized protein YeaO (DUF488 family)
LRLCVSRLLSDVCARRRPAGRDLASAGKVTLLFGAHDIERNNAVGLADDLAAH